MNYQYQTVVVSGTFDHLHKGHQNLLQKALVSSQKVICALTTPVMNQNKILSQTIQSFGKREEAVKDFSKWHKAGKRMTVIPISDRFGPTLKKTPIQAIVASRETTGTIDLINQVRLGKNLPALEKIISPLIWAQDHKRLSSTRIRLGEITRQGKVFSLLFKNKDLVLPQRERKHFQKPIGKLLKGDSQTLSWSAYQAKTEIAKKPSPLVITVGDVVTRALLQSRIPFSLAVIDRKSKRQPLPYSFHRQLFSTICLVKYAPNQPGTISAQMVKTVKKLLLDVVLEVKKGILKIDGEEDLTVVPLVMLAPLGTMILYGQPEQGVVAVRVNEAMKEKIFKLLAKFYSKRSDLAATQGQTLNRP